MTTLSPIKDQHTAHLAHRFTSILALIGLLLISATSVRANIIVISGEPNAYDDIIKLFNENFAGITEIRTGNFSLFHSPETKAALVDADLVILARSIQPQHYLNHRAHGFNSLKIPVVCLTSYITRSDPERLGWHAGPTYKNSETPSTKGSETQLTAAGAKFLGGKANELVDWHHTKKGKFNFIGKGSVGDGEVLCTINGEILVAHWNPGDAPGDPSIAGVDTFPGERLLFNIARDDEKDTQTGDLATLTPAGRAALVAALGSLSPVE